MNNFKFFFLVIVFNYCMLNVIAGNNYYLIKIIRNENDINYDDASEEVQNEIDKLVNDRMNDIYEIINNNKEAYTLENGKIDEKLNELNKFSQLRKRNLNENEKFKFEFINPNELIYKKRKHKANNIKRYLNTTENNEEKVEYIQFKSQLIKHLCPVGNSFVIRAYLPDKILDIVKKLPNIENCEKSFTTQEYYSINYDDNDDMNKYYNKEDILNETKWGGLEVQENNFDFELGFTHLSLISQGKFNDSSNATYDNNYYYPSSAGKGIDVYIIEEGINLTLTKEDLDTYNGERTITCDGSFFDGEFSIHSNINRCDTYKNHGSLVSIAAVGKIHGVAKKANLHLLNSGLDFDDDLLALKYIESKADPKKSVINISRGSLFYSYNIEKQIKVMVEKGFIIFVAAGNYNSNTCNGKYHYSTYPGVIPIGAINNKILNNYGHMEMMYERLNSSNYGECVEFFAPGTMRITVDYLDGKISLSNSGTSLSSPIVAGVAATIMSENPNVVFNYKTMKEKLIELSVKDVLLGLNDNTPNRLINNGKSSIAHPPRCDEPSGKYQCHDKCCSKFGQCVESETDNENIKSLCFIENYCISEFGYCYSKKCDEVISNKKCLDSECCPGIKTRKVYLQNEYDHGCIYAENQVDQFLSYSSVCKEDPNYLWEIPESGSGIWKNIGTNYYIGNFKMYLYTTYKNESITMGNINEYDIPNSIWYDHPDFKNLCYTKNKSSLKFKECDKNNNNQRWIAIDKISNITSTTINNS